MSLSKTVRLTVDGYDIKLSNKLNFYQGDTLMLKCQLNEFGFDVEHNVPARTVVPINPLKASLLVETPQGTDHLEAVEIKENIVEFKLTKKYTQNIGNTKIQIMLYDQDGCQVTLPEFLFEIKENISEGLIEVKGVILSDGTCLLETENNENIVVNYEVHAIDGTPAKQIKDFELKDDVSGQEDILIQDNGITKRLKTSLFQDQIDQTNAQLSEVANKGTTVEVIERVTKKEIERQIDDGTLTNLTIKNNSITAEKVKDGSIPPYKMNNVTPIEPQDLLKGVSITHGYRYNNGVKEAVSTYSITDFIPVIPSHQLILERGKYSLLTIFDENKDFIKEEKVDGEVTDYLFTVPVNGKYVVVNLFNDWISITTLKDKLISELYTVDWLAMREKSVHSDHLIDNCITLSKLTDDVFDGDGIYQYDFKKASSNHQNGYVMTAWFDMSHLSDDVNLKVSIDVKANRDNLSSFIIKAFQYDSMEESGGTGYNSSEFPYLGDEETFSNLSIETTLLKQKNILKVMIWAIGSTPSLPEVIQLKEFNVRLNNEKCKVGLENLGYYGTNSVPEIKKIEQMVTTTNKPIAASKKWVCETFMNYVKSNMNRLKGKKIGVIGDSYVYGHTLGVDKSWVTQLGKRNEMIYFNYGVNGGLLSRANGVAERYQNMNEVLDYIVVFAGHNDATANVTIGNDHDETVDTFKGALNVLCKGLQTKYPKARLLFMTPTHRKGNEAPYGQAIKDICYKYGIQVYDTYAKLGINIGEGNEGNAKQKEVFELVPLHLNELGNEYLSYKVEAELLTL